MIDLHSIFHLDLLTVATKDRVNLCQNQDFAHVFVNSQRCTGQWLTAHDGYAAPLSYSWSGANTATLLAIYRNDHVTKPCICEVENRLIKYMNLLPCQTDVKIFVVPFSCTFFFVCVCVCVLKTDKVRAWSTFQWSVQIYF